MPKPIDHQASGGTGEAPRIAGRNAHDYDVVDGQVVAEVLAGWTGIPVGRMMSNEIRVRPRRGEQLPRASRASLMHWI
jgi:ATP-dependent Clp protease ATP-binding subunit ClpA